MSFLKDIMSPGPMTGSLSLPSCSNNNDMQNEDLTPTLPDVSQEVIDEPHIDENSPGTSSEGNLQAENAAGFNNSQPTGRTSNKRNRRRTEHDDFLAIEKEKIEMLKNSAAIKLDGDYNFLLSFLPVMKKMSEIQKLKFRMQMSNIAYEISTSNDSASSMSSISITNEETAFSSISSEANVISYIINNNE